MARQVGLTCCQYNEGSSAVLRPVESRTALPCCQGSQYQPYLPPSPPNTLQPLHPSAPWPQVRDALLKSTTADRIVDPKLLPGTGNHILYTTLLTQPAALAALPPAAAPALPPPAEPVVTQLSGPTGQPADELPVSVLPVESRILPISAPNMSMRLGQ